jgi:hypothetical protein
VARMLGRDIKRVRNLLKAFDYRSSYGVWG